MLLWGDALLARICVFSCSAGSLWWSHSGFRGQGILPLPMLYVVHSPAVSWA